MAGTQYLIRGEVTRLGRDSGNDIVLAGEEAAVVSSRHAEIRMEGDSYRIYDLNSTNGTWVNGERVAEATLAGRSSIRFGPSGPVLEFEAATGAAVELDKTLVLSAAVSAPGVPLEPPPSQRPIGKQDEDLLTDAVSRARMARGTGVTNQTLIIMRQMLGTAIRRSGYKFKVTIAALVVALLAVSGYGYGRIQELKRAKSDIDQQIQQIESRLGTGGLEAAEIDRLVEKLNTYQSQARELQDSMFYKLGVKGREQAFIEREIKTLLAEFGAEQYSVPPEFVEQVDRFIRQYQERDRPHIERSLGRARKSLEAIRKIFVEQNLPPDLAYMVLVESAFISEGTSPIGAAGLWQFTPSTARAYGMKVSAALDERLDFRKSTLAACRYVRELILDFGSGSSVMLALAAYNSGPGKVKRAVRKVDDPIKQRNFWYLYRVRALPLETREYVPKIIAAIIIGRNLEQLGF